MADRYGFILLKRREENIMANFCTKCGRKLINGQPCICTQQNAEDTQENAYQSETAQAESQQTQQQYTNYEEINYEGPASEQNQSDVAAMTKNFFTQALEMIKHPSTGFASSVADENSKNGLILMGIQALLAGLYLYVFVQKIVSTALNGVSSFLGVSRYVGQTPSFGQFFGYGVILSIVVSLIISGVILGLMNAMGHAKINWFQACQIVGMRSLGSILALILAILGLLLGMYQFAVLIVLVGSVLTFIYSMVAMMSYPGVNKNAVAYIALIVEIVGAIVAYFIMKEFVFSALGSAAGSATNFLSDIL